MPDERWYCFNLMVIERIFFVTKQRFWKSMYKVQAWFVIHIKSIKHIGRAQTEAAVVFLAIFSIHNTGGKEFP